MSLPAVLQRLRIPVIAAPMFIAGNPQLVIEQCKAGVVGSFPALNARPKAALDGWLTDIEAALSQHPGAAPYAVNQICHKSNDRLEHDIEVCIRHKVPITITSLRAPDEVLAGQAMHVSVEVTNTGTLAGRETVQLYVGDEVTQDVVRPVKELKGFHKVELAPGESQVVRFTLNTHDLAYYDVHRCAWITTPGNYRLYVGSSAADIRATRSFTWIAPVDDRAPVEESTFEDDL